MAKFKGEYKKTRNSVKIDGSVQCYRQNWTDFFIRLSSSLLLACVLDTKLMEDVIDRVQIRGNEEIQRDPNVRCKYSTTPEEKPISFKLTSDQGVEKVVVNNPSPKSSATLSLSIPIRHNFTTIYDLYSTNESQQRL